MSSSSVTSPTPGKDASPHTSFETSSVSVTSGTDLLQGITPEIRRLRWQNTAAVVCLSPIISFYFGMSTVMPFMNRMSDSVWDAPGVIQPTLMSFLANAVVLQLGGGFIKSLSPFGIWFAIMTSLISPLLIGVSACTGMVWIQYIGSVLASVGYATALTFRTFAMQWWSLDGNQAAGQALMNSLTGLQIVFFSLVIAWLLDAFGLAVTQFVLAATIFLLGLFPLWLAFNGKLGGPAVLPTEGSTVPSAANVSQTCEKKLWVTRKYWHLWFHTAVFPFVGFSMKALTTTIFEDAYGTDFLNAAYLTALSLSLFVVVRGIAPWLTKHVPVMSLSIGLLTMNLVLYALYPTIVAHASVWVLLAAQTIAGAGFAGLFSVHMLIIVHLYGAASLPRVYASLGTAQAIGYSFGPVVGHYIQVFSIQNGVSSKHAFDVFFYLCAVVAVLGVINLVALVVLKTAEDRSAKVEVKEQDAV